MVRKRLLALVLSASLVVGTLPMNVHAAIDSVNAKQLLAEEVTEVTVFEKEENENLSDSAEAGVHPQFVKYADDDVVTVIVQMEEPAIMDYYDVEAFSAEVSEEASAGEAVSEFLSSEEAVSAEELLTSEQNEVLDCIEKLSEEEELPEGNLEVVSQYVTAVNAAAVRVPYGWISEIRKIDGVKRAYVEKVFDRPETVEAPVTDAGNAGYSYDMTGLSEVWSAGFTGKGMLVAVLDTGLDIEYSSFWDDNLQENVTKIRRTHEAFTENSFKSADAKEHLRYTSDSLAEFLTTVTLNAELTSRGEEVVWDNNALFKNSKVPFAYDYAGAVDEYGEVIGGDLNVRPTESDHGTHVSGTILGYSETEEGVVKFSGVAPDAQLMMMKVFPDANGGAQESVMYKALEDALKLGADVINLSLGSDNGFALDDTAQAQMYKTVDAAGIILMTSAGNSAFSSKYNPNTNIYNQSKDPDISMMSSPAIYDSNLAVASIDNTVDVQSVFTWEDADGETHTVGFNDPNAPSMKYKFDNGNTYRIYPVGGNGEWQDYYNAGFRTSYYDSHPNGTPQTGIALVQRGGISFVDKINNAQYFSWQGYDYMTGSSFAGGVQAVIVYDNVDGALITMSTAGTGLTSCFISKADGEAIVAAVNSGYNVEMKVLTEDIVVEGETGYEMSEFSSWGTGPGLELKPEITAPGGNIWSTILDATYYPGMGEYTDYTGSYGMMSGTSMAAPHMTGISALVEQYVRANHGSLAQSVKKTEASLTSQLLVSTAVPRKDSRDVFYSPRQQGAGLVNAAAAISTPAYITVDGQPVGKIELGDDVSWSGSYDFKFTVNNLTGTAAAYNAVAYILRPDTYTEAGKTYELDRDVLVKTVDLGSVTVPANGSVNVSKTVSLDETEIAVIRELFPNGSYIEGYISLEAANTEDPTIGLPFLGFLGDWTAAPIFDRATWLDGDESGINPWDSEVSDYTWFPSLLGCNVGQIDWITLGQNYYDPLSDSEQKIYHRENIAISPNGDGNLDAIDDIELYMLRDSKLIVVEVKDAETGELYFHDVATYNYRSNFDSNYNVVMPSTLYWFTSEDWKGTDSEGKLLPSGTKCIYTITAYGEGDYKQKFYEELGYEATDFDSVIPGVAETEPTFNGHAMDKTGDVISFPVVVDYEPPKLLNNAVSVFERDGRTYISGTVYDEDGSLAVIEVSPIVTRSYKSGYGDPNYAETGMDRVNPFYINYIYDAGTKTCSFEADITEYTHTNESFQGENYYYDFNWTGNVYISCGDYGVNDRIYAIKTKDAAREGEIILSQTSALLHPGSEFELSVIDNTNSDEAIRRTSSNPRVATIDEYGRIVAVAPGQTTITVSNSVSEATCIVAVEEVRTEVKDFKLSLDEFHGLKPNGSITVRVENLQPSDVKIEEIRWSVEEDEETAEYYEGLVTCTKYESDALTGEIYLNTAYSTQDAIPGGSGTLNVTINGVTRSMKLDWEALYTDAMQDDLTADPLGFAGEQTEYVTFGEAATLVAKYQQNHSFVPVELWTAKGYEMYSYSNPVAPAEGLVLDGPTFSASDTLWTGKIVNKEGYKLPDEIKIVHHYDYGYEYELTKDAYYNGYTYDPETGEISVQAPSGATTSLVIRADGVVSEGNPAGTLSGQTYEKPDGTWGPFDWEFVGGVPGVLTTAENVAIDYYSTKNVAYFKAERPGVSYIKATSKDGKYSLNLAVVTEGVKAETLTVDSHRLDMKAGEVQALTATLSPEPTLDIDREILYTSFDPSVASVDEDGTITAKSAGYAYIKAESATNSRVSSYCIVKVTEDAKPETNGGSNGGANSGAILDLPTFVPEEEIDVDPAPFVPGSGETVSPDESEELILVYEVPGAAKNTDVVVTVYKNADGEITDAQAAVTTQTAGSKVTLSGDVVEKIKELAMGDAAVTLTVTDKNGNTRYTVKVDTKDLVPGNVLYIYAVDKKTGERTLVNAKEYKVAEDGSVKLGMTKNADYELLGKKAAKALNKQILGTVKLKKSTLNVKTGKSAAVDFAKDLDRSNVKKITYTVSDKTVAIVDKNGRITAKKAGNTTVRVQVTLKNGSTKTLKLKVRVK